jgi:hypothetical protein
VRDAFLQQGLGEELGALDGGGAVCLFLFRGKEGRGMSFFSPLSLSSNEEKKTLEKKTQKKN